MARKNCGGHGVSSGAVLSHEKNANIGTAPDDTPDDAPWLCGIYSLCAGCVGSIQSIHFVPQICDVTCCERNGHSRI